MEVIISLALLAVGGIIGFFVARHLYGGSRSGQNVAQAQQELKEMLAQQAQHHVFQTKQTIESIEKQCASLKQQVADYEAVLQTSDEESSKVPFYGEQVTSYLQHNLQTKPAKLQAVADTQPKDFASSPSGLFVGSNEQSNAEPPKN